jgi:cytochrome P450
LYDLAAYPEHIAPLREEIEGVIGDGGWRKANIEKMWKLDSFIKESLRLHAIHARKHSVLILIVVANRRKVVKPFTFSDGRKVTPGETLAAPANAIHLDDQIYENAESFDGFRFSKLRKQDESAKHLSVSISPDYLAFGYGRHPWYVTLAAN